MVPKTSKLELAVPNVNQFESVFKSAAKAVYRYKPIKLERALMVSDLDVPRAQTLVEQVRGFLGVAGQSVQWTTLDAEQSRTVEGLLGAIQQQQPDLVCTYRNLHTSAWRWPHSLGRHLDVLTQATNCPVMVIPHPNADADLQKALGQATVVMAMTDHLAGDDQLVNFAVSLTRPDGTLYLSHIEDKAILDRYIKTISKIPTINTDNAHTQIRRQLLKEPGDYIDSCRRALKQHNLPIQIEPIVGIGHHLGGYRQLVAEHGVDLLLMNTKDEDQLAMHGMAYPLAVELRETPLLML